MPRIPEPESLEDRIAQEIVDEDDAHVKAIGEAAGPPPDSRRMSEADEDEAWEAPDPNVDYDTMAQMLMTQGLPPEMAQSLLFLKLRPEWAPLYSRPTQDAERAHMLARLAEKPFRLSVLEDLDDPEEQVKKAERIDRRYQKRMTAAQEQATMPRMTAAGSGYGQGGA